MSMSELPMVVCFHLKRFEHELHALKIDSIVRFPETLNMKPYLAESLRDGSSSKVDDEDDSYVALMVTGCALCCGCNCIVVTLVLL